jgi:hypothetical protein
MTRKIVDYLWVSNYSTDFAEGVKLALSAGWQPLGSPIYSSREDFCHQAMVKYEEKSDGFLCECGSKYTDDCPGDCWPAET